MSEKTSLERDIKRLALGWTSAGLMLMLSLTLSIAYWLPFRETETRIKTIAAATIASRRTDILSGDVRAAELQIRKDLGLKEDEAAFFIDPEGHRWVKGVQGSSLRPCANATGVCVDHFAKKVIAYAPIFFDIEGKSKWGSLYLERHPDTNWTLVIWITASIFLSMSIQIAGFYFGLSKAMEKVASALTNWAMKLSLSPKNRKTYEEMPYSEIAPIESALNGLRTEIDQLEDVARKEGALSMLRSIGHDILNPVSRMKRILGIIESDGLKIDQELFGSLYANVKRLSCYAEQLRFIYMREADDDPGRKTNVTNVSSEVSDLVQEMVFDPEVLEREIELKSEIDDDHGSFIPAAALGRLMENLCSNAVQASNDGGLVRVGVTSTVDRVAISVSDQGNGIPESIRERVFDAGFTSRPNRGTGLGLFVVKHICSQYGGKVTFDSRVGEGTTFRVEFPRAEVVANGL